jgi:TM2 domain-containing membrane protein YozV
MKLLLSAFASFVIPGLGQLFHGKFLWGLVWLIAAICLGPGVNILSACHAGFLSMS